MSVVRRRPLKGGDAHFERARARELMARAHLHRAPPRPFGALIRDFMRIYAPLCEYTPLYAGLRGCTWFYAGSYGPVLSVPAHQIPVESTLLIKMSSAPSRSRVIEHVELAAASGKSLGRDSRRNRANLYDAVLRSAVENGSRPVT